MPSLQARYSGVDGDNALPQRPIEEGAQAPDGIKEDTTVQSPRDAELRLCIGAYSHTTVRTPISFLNKLTMPLKCHRKRLCLCPWGMMELSHEYTFRSHL